MENCCVQHDLASDPAQPFQDSTSGHDSASETGRGVKMVMQTYKGSCHCGAIQFAFEAENITRGVRCNCSFCSRRGAMMHPVPGAQFHMEAEEGTLGLYQFGKKQAKHFFCRNCGIHVFTETPRRPGQFIVNLGCVDGVDTFALETTVFDGKNLL
jgi:hypothetical protein